MTLKADGWKTPIDRLMEFANKELEQYEIEDFLRDEGVAGLDDFERGMNAVSILQQYLLENEPFELAKGLIPRHALNDIERALLKTGERRRRIKREHLISDLFERLGIPHLPTFKLNYFSLDNLKAILDQTNETFKSNPEKAVSVKGLLHEAGAILEDILLFTLIFYKRVFAVTPITSGIIKSEQNKRAKHIPSLGDILNEIEKIQKIFEEDIRLQEWAWLKFQRLSPFEDLPFDLLRQFKNDYRDQYSHRSTPPLLERDENFIRDALKTLQATVGKLDEKNIVPIAIIILYRGRDVYRRHIWGFWDEWTLSKKEITQTNEENRMEAKQWYNSTRWFRTRNKAPYKCYVPYFLVNRQGDGFCDPLLLPQQEIKDEFEKILDAKLKRVEAAQVTEAEGTESVSPETQATPAKPHIEVTTPTFISGTITMKKIFISYSHRDKGNVDLLAQQLKLYGLHLWRDLDNLPLGTQTPEQIRETLSNECQGCILYLTPNSLASDFVMKIELKEAMERLSTGAFVLIPIFHGVTIDEAKTKVPGYSGRNVTNLNGVLISDTASTDEMRSKFAEAAQRLLQNLLEKSRAEFSSDPNRKLILDMHTRQYSYRDPEPDIDVDWRPFMQTDGTIDATVCSQTLWPALLSIKNVAAQTLGTRQLLCRASAHLSCGVALGFAFRATTRFQLEIEQPIPGQGTQLWSTTGFQPAPSPLQIDKSEGTIGSEEAVVELSVSRITTNAVDAWENLRKQSGKELCVRLAIKPPNNAIKHDVVNNTEANAIAQQVADEIAKLYNDYPVRVIHLFMSAPLALAMLIGYRLNARGVIQLYELRGTDQVYVPSFKLT